MPQLVTHDAAGTTSELSFVVILRYFIRLRILLAAVFSAVFVLSCLYLGTRPDSYRAQTVISAPSTDQVSSGLSIPSAARSLLGGGSTESPEFTEFINSFNTMRLANRLANDQPLMHAVFDDQWDARLGRWNPPHSFAQTFRAIIASIFGYPAWHKPTAFDLRDYIDRRVTIKHDPEGSFQLVSYENENPLFAGKFLRMTTDTMDQILKETRQLELQRREAFLRKKIEAETNTVVISAIYQLLSSILSKQVELGGSKYYAVEMIDPVYVIPMPVFPKPAIVIVLSIIIAIVLSLGVVFVMGLLRFTRRALTRS